MASYADGPRVGTRLAFSLYVNDTDGALLKETYDCQLFGRDETGRVALKSNLEEHYILDITATATTTARRAPSVLDLPCYIAHESHELGPRAIDLV